MPAAWGDGWISRSTTAPKGLGLCFGKGARTAGSGARLVQIPKFKSWSFVPRNESRPEPGGGSTTIKLRVGIIFVFQPPLYVCPGSCASSHDLVRGPALARGSAGQVAFGAVRVGGEALPRVSWVESPMRCLGCVCEGGLSGWRCRQGEGIGREGRRRRGR